MEKIRKETCSTSLVSTEGRASILFLLLITLILSFSSCVHQPLYYMTNTHYIRVYVDEELLNVNKGFYNENYKRGEKYSIPEIFRVMIYDPSSGRMISERYLRDMGIDEKGRYYDGYIVCPPGNFKLLAYNFGTFTSLLKNETNYYEAFAYTNSTNSTFDQIPSRSKSSYQSVYQPDFFMVENKDITVQPVLNGVDTLYTQNGGDFVAKSIVKAYYTQIRVKGLQYISSVSGFFSGVSNKSILHNGTFDTNPFSLYFDMYIDRVSDTEGIIYGTFNTYGIIDMLGKTNLGKIAFDLSSIDGRIMTAEIGIESAIKRREAIENQWLLFDMTIEIQPPPPGEGGGLSPGVDKWKDISADVYI